MALDLANVPLDAKCAECGRLVAPEAAFTSEDKLFCGSCAPAGAAPARIELSQQAAFTPVVPGQKPDKVATIMSFVSDLLGLKKS